jgi:hypothetical protein
LGGGCSKTTDLATPQGSETTAGPTAASEDGPETAVSRFLEAVRTGDDQQTEAMFTKLAREKIRELEDIQVAPPGSDTAKFTVGKPEMLGEDGARVPSQWTDLDHDGHPRTDEITWMVRKEPEGWRIAGMAADIFEGEDPLLLDFENPKETLRKLELLREEIRQRGEKASQQATQPPNPSESVRR